MQWVWEDLRFRKQPFKVAHFEAPGRGCQEVDDELTVNLDRCTEELGACLWHETNAAALHFFETRQPHYTGLKVLELGAGAGVCGLALAIDGADVTITDLDALVPLLELNVVHNGFADVAQQSTFGGVDIGAKARQGRKHAKKKRGGKDNWSDEEGAAGSNTKVVAIDEMVVADGAPAKLSAKERRAARSEAKEAKKTGKISADLDFAANGAGDECVEDTNGPSNFQARGQCRAQAADWLREAQHPTLEKEAFDIVIIVDCLYENKDSWDALLELLNNVLAPGAELVLASATLRRPFLDEFSSRLEGVGFAAISQEVTEHATIATLCLVGRTEGQGG